MNHLTPLEWIGLLIVLTMVIGTCAVLLAVRIRFHFQTKEQKSLEREHRSHLIKPVHVGPELWPFPPKDKYAPGEWGGPTRALERFLTHLRTFEGFEDLPERRQREILAMPKAQRFGLLYGRWRRV